MMKFEEALNDLYHDLDGKKLGKDATEIVVEVDHSFSVSTPVVGENFTFQWQYKSPTGTAWGNSTLPGNKTSVLTVLASSGRNGYRYRCVVSYNGGTYTTAPVQLRVMQEGVSYESGNMTVLPFVMRDMSAYRTAEQQDAATQAAISAVMPKKNTPLEVIRQISVTEDVAEIVVDKFENETALSLDVCYIYASFAKTPSGSKYINVAINNRFNSYNLGFASTNASSTAYFSFYAVNDGGCLIPFSTSATNPSTVQNTLFRTSNAMQEGGTINRISIYTSGANIMAGSTITIYGRRS
jgi:hypothetical protein